MVVRRVGRVQSKGFVAAAALSLTVVVSGVQAEARPTQIFRHAFTHHVAHAAREALGGGGVNFSAIVVDANSGRTLYAVNEDAPRHPASITKVMTLYLLFEQLDRRRISLDSPLEVSAHAASQAPTKLGLRPGATITVENAIKAIVTKSANDMAVAVAENLAGDEESFARLMTEKAHALGMTHTFYHNASGLPDMRQITTARDLTVLGRAIHDRFPHYYRYFSTPSFTYAGSFMPNHNHLMARVTGMDGIKTGYTNASGFNLLSSVNRGGRHIVSVVLGGKTAASRDRIMESLIEGHIEEASATPSTRVAEGSPIEDPAETPAAAAASVPVEHDLPAGRRTAALSESDGGPVERDLPAGPNPPAPEAAMPEAEAPEAPVPEAAPPAPPRPAAAQRPPERARVAEAARAEMPKVPPLPVRPPAGKPRPAFIAGAPKIVDPGRLPAPLSARERRILAADGSTARRTVVASAAPTPIDSATPSSLRWVTGAPPARLGAGPLGGKSAVAAKVLPISFSPVDDRTGTTGPGRAKATVQPYEEAAPPPAKGGWVIQIGAPDSAGAAADLLTRARSEGRSALASAKPFTEKVQKGKETLYRARFAGLDPGAAETACKTLKRSGFACFAVRN